MAEYKELIFPLAVALISALVTAIFTLKLKFASSEKEAIDQILELLKKAVFYVLLVWLAYDLIRRGSSTESISRQEILLMILDSFSILLVLFLFFTRNLLNLIGKSFDLHVKHTKHAEEAVSIMKSHSGLIKSAISSQKPPASSSE